MNLSNKNKNLEEAAKRILFGEEKLKNGFDNIDESVELEEAAKRNPIEDWIHLRHNDVRTFLDNLKPMLKLVKSASDEAVGRTLDGISSKYNEYLSDMIWDYFLGSEVAPKAVKASLITFKRDVVNYLNTNKGVKADDILDAFDDFRINLKKNMRRFKEHIEEAKPGNDKQYKWSDINKALMHAGFGPKVIVQVMMKLRGKEIKEELEESPLLESFDIPTSTREVNQLVKDAVDIKATEKDVKNLWNKIKDSLAGTLETLSTKSGAYKKAYEAGYDSLGKPKNPFKKDTLAYWFFENSYLQGKDDA